MQAPGSCNGVVRRVLFLQRAAAACALADGPGAPSVEGTILRALRARSRTRRPHSAAQMCVSVSSPCNVTIVRCMQICAVLLFSILRALRARVERAAALDGDRGAQHLRVI